jgi:hypothetical protein
LITSEEDVGAGCNHFFVVVVGGGGGSVKRENKNRE